MFVWKRFSFEQKDHYMRRNLILLFIAVPLVLSFVFMAYIKKMKQDEASRLLKLSDVMTGAIAQVEVMKRQVDAIARARGFFEWPNPPEGRSYYFLVLASVPGPEDSKTSFHIAYDLVNPRYVPIRNAEGAIDGQGFVLEISSQPNGSLVKSSHTGTNAIEIMNRFGITPSTMR